MADLNLADNDTRTAFILVLILAGLMGGCTGYDISYNKVGIGFSQEGTTRVAIATVDQRSYVLNGKKNPQFIGLLRGMVGNPFSMPTQSGAPLATDITNEIAQSLKEKGFRTLPVIVDPPTDMDQAKEKLRATGHYRSILVIINEWKTDSYARTRLDYHVELKVFDKAANLLAETSLKGKDTIPSGALDPISWPKTRKMIAQAFKEKFEALLNQKDIVDALVAGE